MRFRAPRLRLAKKELPERSCPRGAEDSNLFRERLDASAWQLSRRRIRPSLYSKRTAGFRANRSASRSAEEPDFRPALPVQTHPRGSSLFLLASRLDYRPATSLNSRPINHCEAGEYGNRDLGSRAVFAPVFPRFPPDADRRPGAESPGPPRASELGTGGPLSAARNLI